jgi:hypothetical protein
MKKKKEGSMKGSVKESTQIMGFMLTYKDEEHKTLTFSHQISGNTLTMPATNKEMRRFHLYEHYELWFTLEDMHHRKGEKAA